ncbi:MAG: CAP domain-containing protein [Candidatus Saccharibacteria bacterium]|nr:CAP domain-containing protein [Candidatus Saccharibacteria bacterium]
MNGEVLHRPKITILLSINAAAILIAGILISSSIWLNGGLEFRVAGERSDIVEGDIDELNPIGLSLNGEDSSERHSVLIDSTNHESDNSAVPEGELWNEDSITIYATPDADICVGGGLTSADLGEMYWQTSNSNVIAGFYDGARTWLGYDSGTCRYPVISGTGSVTITAGTYDGQRKDSIVINVETPPVKQWEHEVLAVVNKLRVKNGLDRLVWGYTCEEAAEIRATETKQLYSHTRPDGSSWSTACPAPSSGGESGENLAIGNAAVSPSTVVALWMDSDAHRANILNPDFTKLSVGFVYDPASDYKTYWSQFFSTY